MFSAEVFREWWPVIVAVVAVALMALEVRLSRAGFVKQSDLNGVSVRLEGEQKAMQKETEAISRQLLVARTDLDATRDRVTVQESRYDALEARVEEAVIKPIGRIEGKMDRFLEIQAAHSAQIEHLKDDVDRLKTKGAA